jgi:hypothetical protein
VEFISCNRKKSRPKVHVTVCNACKRQRSCDDYSRYRQPLLFANLALPVEAKKTRRKRAYSKPLETKQKQEQLGMEKLFDRA